MLRLGPLLQALAWTAVLTGLGLSSASAEAGREVPEALAQFEPDIARASACMGTPPTEIDFEQLAEATFLSGPMQIRTIYRLQRPGLFVETLAARGSRREGAALTSMFGRWENTITFTSNDWEDFLEKAVQTRSVACNEPILPIAAGKTIEYSNVVSHLWLVTSKLLRTHGYEYDSKVRLEVLEGPLSAAALAERYPQIKLLGDAALRWKVYAVRTTTTKVHTAYDPTDSLPADGTQVCNGIFIEGPNHHLCLDDYAKEKWTFTFKER